MLVGEEGEEGREGDGGWEGVCMFTFNRKLKGDGDGDGDVLICVAIVCDAWVCVPL